MKLPRVWLIIFFCYFIFKLAKKEEIVRRLEGDLSSLQDTVKSYADEVRDGVVTRFAYTKEA